MSYVQSNQIQVFPSTRRTKRQQDARLVTEKALVGIINQLVDKDAFIVTKKSDVGLNNPFAFNIKGYYFSLPELKHITDLFNENSTDKYIYASITLDTGNGYTELLGQDDSMGDPSDDAVYVYRGVNFVISNSETGPTGTDVYSFRILERDAHNQWICPESSFYKFSGDNIDFTIDGGIIS